MYIIFFTVISMDKIFEKFGLYDFMGIWGPGAISVTYYLFAPNFLLWKLFSTIKIAHYNIAKSYLLLFLYTAVAYTVGVVLHELGKLFFDTLSIFDFEKINFFDEKQIKKKAFFPFKRIRYDYNRTISHINKDGINLKDVILSSTEINFFASRKMLKYNKEIDSKRVDTYHSVYALSRSLFIAFTIHIILTVCSVLAYFDMINLIIILIDLILAYIFFCRAYRYFLYWIKNTYVQYFFCIYSKTASTIKSIKTTNKKQRY